MAYGFSVLVNENSVLCQYLAIIKMQNVTYRFVEIVEVLTLFSTVA